MQASLAQSARKVQRAGRPRGASALAAEVAFLSTRTSDLKARGQGLGLLPPQSEMQIGLPSAQTVQHTMLQRNGLLVDFVACLCLVWVWVHPLEAQAAGEAVGKEQLGAAVAPCLFVAVEAGAGSSCEQAHQRSTLQL